MPAVLSAIVGSIGIILAYLKWRKDFNIRREELEYDLDIRREELENDFNIRREELRKEIITTLAAKYGF